MGAFTNWRIRRYLKNRHESEYSELDKLFVLYLDGKLSETLERYGLYDIEIYPSIMSKNRSNIQIYCSYYNLVKMSEFREKNFEYCIYERGDPVESLDENFVIVDYKKGFTFENFIAFIYDKLEKDPRLNKRYESLD